MKIGRRVFNCFRALEPENLVAEILLEKMPTVPTTPPILEHDDDEVCISL